jgi:hypothetical protein
VGQRRRLEKFFVEMLMAAYEKVGDIPQPDVKQFDVHASSIAS